MQFAGGNLASKGADCGWNGQRWDVHSCGLNISLSHVLNTLQSDTIPGHTFLVQTDFEGQLHQEHLKLTRAGWWSSQRREETRKGNVEPADTLFVVNFNVEDTQERDLEKFFGKFGRLTRVQIRRTYAFVQFESVDQATEAQKETHLSRFMGIILTKPHTLAVLASETREGDLQNVSKNPCKTWSVRYHQNFSHWVVAS